MKPTIKWNADFFGVEIQTEDERFIIEVSPSKVMTWFEAVRYYTDSYHIPTRQLPTVKQMQIVAKYIDEVNGLIKENGGYELRGLFWTADEIDEFCAWSVLVGNGSTYNDYKDYNDYVRAVSDLKN
jgi:hypothetical protein